METSSYQIVFEGPRQGRIQMPSALPYRNAAFEKQTADGPALTVLCQENEIHRMLPSQSSQLHVRGEAKQLKSRRLLGAPQPRLTDPNQQDVRLCCPDRYRCLCNFMGRLLAFLIPGQGLKAADHPINNQTVKYE